MLKSKRDKCRNFYIAYDLKNNENVEKCGTSKELSKYFNMSIATFYCTVCRKTKIKHRYLVKKVEE